MVNDFINIKTCGYITPRHIAFFDTAPSLFLIGDIPTLFFSKLLAYLREKETARNARQQYRMGVDKVGAWYY